MPKKRFNSGRERRYAILGLIGLVLLVALTVGLGAYAFAI
ncbi:hypothetical protein GCM10028789_13960 [Sinomonas halotolerans]